MGFPSVYQLNARICLQEIGQALGRPATLDEIPDTLVEELVRRGFSWLWLLGVWQTGELGRQVAREDLELRTELARELPDVRSEDIVGSPFAVWSYQVHRDFGGDRALERLRRRLARQGILLILDFVPNHIAVDHPWVFDHPEFLIHGREQDLADVPQNYVRVETRLGPAIVAHGRDPNFPGWRDTVQLNYRHAGLRQAQTAALSSLAQQCDGLRCDMAMLLQPEIIARTWGDAATPVDGSPPEDAPFWPAAIAAVRHHHPDFLFVAEVYWGMEWTLQQQGFDFTYDKRLYDRLRAGVAGPVRQHLQATPAFLGRGVHFLENHDEERAAAVFEPARHRAAAVTVLMAAGMRLVHEGQIDGRRVKVSMVLGRRIAEAVDPSLRSFYERLLSVLARSEAHRGYWRLWPCAPAQEGDPTFEQFIVSTWEEGDRRLLVVVNYAPSPGRAVAALALPGLSGRRWRLMDLMGATARDVEGEAMVAGLTFDLEAWAYQVLSIAPA